MNPFPVLFRKRNERIREHRMIQNGSRLIKDLITACDGKNYCPIHVYSAEEIKQALGHRYWEDHFFDCYTGTHADQKVFIKKFKEGLEEYATNEIVTVTQINYHANVLKLLGCCLEMESPALVYEQIPQRLSDRLHGAYPSGSLMWEDRLRIATEIASAITYLHVAKTRPIVHRGMRSSNIFLDYHYRPKLCDFEFSMTIPRGQTCVETNVFVGTRGYVDPYYAESGVVSEKTDVYIFGVLLLEILSGKDPRQPVKLGKDEEFELWEFALERINDEKRLKLILDNGLSMNERQLEQSMNCINIAGRCLAYDPDLRPPMKEVVQLLQRIQRFEPFVLPPIPLSDLPLARLHGKEDFGGQMSMNPSIPAKDWLLPSGDTEEQMKAAEGKETTIDSPHKSKEKYGLRTPYEVSPRAIDRGSSLHSFFSSWCENQQSSG